MPRLDQPSTFTVVVAHEAEFNGNELVGRERRLIIANEILPDSRGYFVLSPRDEPAKQVTSFTGGYTESLIQDLETASEFCAISISADRCLFISLNYRPCRVIENCDYHTVTEATMVIIRSEDGALFATLTEQLRPSGRSENDDRSRQYSLTRVYQARRTDVRNHPVGNHSRNFKR